MKGVAAYQRSVCLEVLWTVCLGLFNFFGFCDALDYCYLIMDISIISSTNIYVPVTGSSNVYLCLL